MAGQYLQLAKAAVVLILSSKRSCSEVAAEVAAEVERLPEEEGMQLIAHNKS